GSSPGFIEVSVCWGTQQSAHRSRGPAAPAIRLAAALRVLYSPTRKLRGARSGGERVNGTEFLLGPEALARHGERVALVCGAESVTYAELARQSALAAAAYASLGVKPGDKVLLLMRDTPQFAAAWLGLVRMGAVAVALNNKVSEAEYRHVLADSEARLALVEDGFVGARRDLSAELAAQGRRGVAGGQEAASSPRPGRRPSIEPPRARPAQRRASCVRTMASPASELRCARSASGRARKHSPLHASSSPMALSTGCSARSRWAQPPSCART